MEMFAKDIAKVMQLSIHKLRFETLESRLEEQVASLEEEFDQALFEEFHCRSLSEIESFRRSIQILNWEHLSFYDHRFKRYIKRVDSVLGKELDARTKRLDDMAKAIFRNKDLELLADLQEQVLSYPFKNLHCLDDYPETHRSVDKFYLLYRIAVFMNPQARHETAKQKLQDSMMYIEKDFKEFYAEYVRDVQEPFKYMKKHQGLLPGYKRYLVRLLLPSEFRMMKKAIRKAGRDPDRYAKLKSRLNSIKSQLKQLLQSEIENPDLLRQDIVTHEKELDSLSECEGFFYTSGVYASCSKLLDDLYCRIS